jgi:hypothetical protein
MSYDTASPAVPRVSEERRAAMLARVTEAALGWPSVGRLLDAPCLFCAYDGQGYYQSGTHSTDCPWHVVGGSRAREVALPAVLTAALAPRRDAVAGAPEVRKLIDALHDAADRADTFESTEHAMNAAVAVLSETARKAADLLSALCGSADTQEGRTR